MSKPSHIAIPSIPIITQAIWDDLAKEYRKAEVVVEGGLKLKEIFFYLGHTRNNSTMLHSVVSHMHKEIGNYKFDDSYRLLKAVVLESFFSLRESIAGLVNVVYNLGIDVEKSGSSHKIFKETKIKDLRIAGYLNELIPQSSKLGNYLKKYRHPFIQREDLSGFSVQDITSMLIGKEQPRITEFITKSHETSLWMKEIESSIAKECKKQLNLS
ncbi:hypothetical protein ACFLUH_01225 [Chloroflexota bacterium]